MVREGIRSMTQIKFSPKHLEKESDFGDFPGGPVVKTLCFQCRGTGSVPGQGTEIPHAV